MRAAILRRAAPVDTSPLELVDLEAPIPGGGEVRVRVEACGLCRTDLHVVEGELPPRRAVLVPGHQVAGTVDAVGDGVTRFRGGERVGIPWLHRTCGECRFCRSDRENLCEAADFTGWTVDGGYAEFAVAPANYVYPIPAGFGALEAAPLLCAGIIGFRSLRRAGLTAGTRLGLWGFGAAAHVTIQVARHMDIEVYAFSREPAHRDLALDLGAAWAGGSFEPPPRPLDGAIIFAPAGELVPAALAAVDKGARVVLGGIHMSPIPSFEYSLLYGERGLVSVANNTRRDGEDFLRIAAEIPIRTETQTFPLEAANEALQALKHDRIRGAAVLRVSPP